MTAKTRSITVDALARIEGEASARLKIRDGKVEDVQVGVFEPPRFFEGILRGRSYLEVPDIVARICGICPAAYQITAAQALEDALGLSVDPGAKALRRLLYLGEWIESHALHAVLLHAPDFLGFDDAIKMARVRPQEVADALELKKIGNEVVATVGGREIHPVNIRVGGVWKAPARKTIRDLVPRLERARELAGAALRWIAHLPYPELERDWVFVTLDGDGYPLDGGRIVSSLGLAAAPAEFDAHFEEDHVRHSNALQVAERGRGPYLVGPMARWALAGDRLPEEVLAAAEAAGLERPCRNPFRSVLVRTVETLWACTEAERLARAYEPPERPYVTGGTKPSVGHACTEAPRGMLYHRYRMDDRGTILDAKIVPPTAQNLKTIESDLGVWAERNLNLGNAELARACERAVRNHDPCISCATHFLRVEVERS